MYKYLEGGSGEQGLLEQQIVEVMRLLVTPTLLKHYCDILVKIVRYCLVLGNAVVA